jgi:hypothetical protein
MVSRLVWQRSSIKFCANLEKSGTEALAVIRQAFGGESMSSTWKGQLTEIKKGKTGEEQNQSMLIIFIDIKRPFTKNSSWQAKQSVPHIQTLATRELAIASEQHTVSRFLFHQTIFDQKQHDHSSPTHPTFL